MEPEALTPLERACRIAGNATELARQIGRRQSTVWDWLHQSGRKVPAEACADIERATKGRVKRHDLRPDVFDPPKRRKAA